MKTNDREQSWEFRDEPCKGCGGRDFRVLGFRGGAAHRDGAGVRTRIVRCCTCALIFPNPMPYPAGEDRRYSDVSGYFDEVMAVTEEGQRRFGAHLARDAERLLGGRGRFLDIGCGRGAVVWAAQARGSSSALPTRWVAARICTPGHANALAASEAGAVFYFSREVW